MSTFSSFGNEEGHGHEPWNETDYLEVRICDNFDDIVAHVEASMPRAGESMDHSEKQGIVMMAKSYAEILRGPRAPDEAEMTAYSALHLAKIVSDYCLGEATPLPYGRYFADPAKLAAQKRMMHLEERAYLWTRPAVSMLLDECIDLLDPTEGYDDVARTVAAVTFKSVEEAFIIRTATSLRHELDTWDDTATE